MRRFFARFALVSLAAIGSASPRPALETRFVEEPRSRTLSRVGLGLVGGAEPDPNGWREMV